MYTNCTLRLALSYIMSCNRPTLSCTSHKCRYNRFYLGINHTFLFADKIDGSYAIFINDIPFGSEIHWVLFSYQLLKSIVQFMNKPTLDKYWIGASLYLPEPNKNFTNPIQPWSSDAQFSYEFNPSVLIGKLDKQGLFQKDI